MSTQTKSSSWIQCNSSIENSNFAWVVKTTWWPKLVTIKQTPNSQGANQKMDPTLSRFAENWTTFLTWGGSSSSSITWVGFYFPPTVVSRSPSYYAIHSTCIPTSFFPPFGYRFFRPIFLSWLRSLSAFGVKLGQIVSYSVRDRPLRFYTNSPITICIEHKRQEELWRRTTGASLLDISPGVVAI